MAKVFDDSLLLSPLNFPSMNITSVKVASDRRMR